MVHSFQKLPHPRFLPDNIKFKNHIWWVQLYDSCEWLMRQYVREKSRNIQSHLWGCFGYMWYHFRVLFNSRIVSVNGQPHIPFNSNYQNSAADKKSIGLLKRAPNIVETVYGNPGKITWKGF